MDDLSNKGLIELLKTAPRLTDFSERRSGVDTHVVIKMEHLQPIIDALLSDGCSHDPAS